MPPVELPVRVRSLALKPVTDSLKATVKRIGSVFVGSGWPAFLFTVTVGFYADGTPGEVFVDSRKTDGDVESIARDAAVLLSLALQHGVAVESVRHAIMRNGNGTPSSILGAVIDVLAVLSR